MAFETCDLLALLVRDLIKMKLEFPKIFDELFNEIPNRLKKELMLKIEIIKKEESNAL